MGASVSTMSPKVMTSSTETTPSTIGMHILKYVFTTTESYGTYVPRTTIEVHLDFLGKSRVRAALAELELNGYLLSIVPNGFNEPNYSPAPKGWAIFGQPAKSFFGTPRPRADDAMQRRLARYV